MAIFIATSIRMKSGCYYSNNLLEIDEIYLDNNGWYKKELLHEYLKQNPNTIKVGTSYGPYVIPATSPKGEKYVKSSPNSTTRDNLLSLTRK